MEIRDVIYGTFEIEEQVLVDLINSKPVQRLKTIEQQGLPEEYDIFPGYKRYEHSVGVMLLLKKLKASIEEQITGLLHDVSHTAFSHVVDWVMGDRVKEDFQDKVHQDIISNSEIPKNNT